MNVFADANIPTDIKLYAKWRITLDAFSRMSEPDEAIPHILEVFCHPLNFQDPQVRKDFVEKLNAILAYDKLGLMDTVNLDELGVRARIEDEIKRFNKFRSGVLGHKQDKIAIDVDVRNYTKYLLKEGTLIEKRELLGCLQSKLFLKDKKVTME